MLVPGPPRLSLLVRCRANSGSQPSRTPALLQPASPKAQSLYDGYADAIRQAVRDAIANGWYWQEFEPSGPPTWHGIGKSGILAVWDVNVIRTAFFKLDDGDSSKRRAKEGRRHQGPLPRKGVTSNKLVGVPEDTPLGDSKSWKPAGTLSDWPMGERVYNRDGSQDLEGWTTGGIGTYPSRNGLLFHRPGRERHWLDSCQEIA